MKTAQASFRAQYQVGGGLGARAEGRKGGDDDGGGAFLPSFEFRISQTESAIGDKKRAMYTCYRRGDLAPAGVYPRVDMDAGT